LAEERTPLVSVDRIEVPLRSRRQQRAQLAQKLQHVFPAAVLLFAGLQQITGEPHGWGLLLAILEIVVGLLMLASLARTVHAGRARRLDLSDLENASTVRHALERAQLRLPALNTAE
jgi:hypothetical protein